MVLFFEKLRGDGFVHEYFLNLNPSTCSVSVCYRPVLVAEWASGAWSSMAAEWPRRARLRPGQAVHDCPRHRLVHRCLIITLFSRGMPWSAEIIRWTFFTHGPAVPCQFEYDPCMPACLFAQAYMTITTAYSSTSWTTYPKVYTDVSG